MSEEKKDSKSVHCIQPGCKKTYRDEDEATKDGAYQNVDRRWYCHQHNPNTRRKN